MKKLLPWRTLRPSPFPTPGRAWGTYVVCGCCRAVTTARANALTQILPNLSSLHTLFYSVIYNSVVYVDTISFQILRRRCLEIYSYHRKIGNKISLRTRTHDEGIYKRFVGSVYPSLFQLAYFTHATVPLTRFPIIALPRLSKNEVCKKIYDLYVCNYY